MRHPLAVLGFLLVLALSVTVPSGGHAAAPSPVAVPTITISPEAPVRGTRPMIAARIARTSDQSAIEPASFTIIAVITLPNNVTKSSMWKNELFARGQVSKFTFEVPFDTTLDGKYRIEFNVYSNDMRKRITSAAKDFWIGVPAPTTPAEPRAAVQPKKRGEPKRLEPERNVLGFGLWGNTLNTAGGGTLLLWPIPGIGLQGSYTVGTFTSTEARLVAKYDRPGSFSPYLAVGYVNVSVEKNIIGVNTEFKDSGVSGALGVEIPLGRRFAGFAEVGGASITLEKYVTSGGQTVKATVDYAPVTISLGIVYYFF